MEKIDCKTSITSSDDEVELSKTKYSSGMITVAGTSKLDHLLNAKANSPKYLLLEDSTLESLPKYVTNIYKNYYNNKIIHKNDAEILMLLIYCIALETGFTSKSSITNTLSTSTSLGGQISNIATSAITTITQNNSNNLVDVNNYPFFWGFSYHSRIVSELAEQVPIKIQDDINKNLYKIDMKLLNVTNKNCLLTGIHSGEYLILTLTVDSFNESNISAGRSICLSIPRYILRMESKNLAEILRNLGELSLKLKDDIFIPTRNLLMENENKLYPGLSGLPGELLSLIFNNLSIVELQLLSKSCWKLRCYCVDYYEFKYKPKKFPYGSKNRLNSSGGSQSTSSSKSNFYK